MLGHHRFLCLGFLICTDLQRRELVSRRVIAGLVPATSSVFGPPVGLVPAGHSTQYEKLIGLGCDRRPSNSAFSLSLAFCFPYRANLFALQGLHRRRGWASGVHRHPPVVSRRSPCPSCLPPLRRARVPASTCGGASEPLTATGGAVRGSAGTSSAKRGAPSAIPAAAWGGCWLVAWGGGGRWHPLGHPVRRWHMRICPRRRFRPGAPIGAIIPDTWT